MGTRHHLWKTTMLYDLPFGRGRRFAASAPHALDTILGGWRLSNIFTPARAIRPVPVRV
jgi:hypothetical protein